jgi:hypothetical protein
MSYHIGRLVSVITQMAIETHDGPESVLSDMIISFKKRSI